MLLNLYLITPGIFWKLNLELPATKLSPALIDPAPIVFPWKDLSEHKTNFFFPSKYLYEIFKAPSLASAPELQKNTYWRLLPNILLKFELAAAKNLFK